MASETGERPRGLKKLPKNNSVPA